MVKCIPLYSFNLPNRLVWKGTLDGKFTVKNAYHFYKEILEQSRGQISTNVDKSKMWKLTKHFYRGLVERVYLLI